MAVYARARPPKEDRRRIIRDFREGKFQVLVNCNLVREGFDVPDADLLIRGTTNQIETTIYLNS